MKRYFEFVGEDRSRGISQSAKFWEVWIDESTLHTRFGKIGANGQTTIKEFSSDEEATLALEKAVAAKVKKGYVEKSAGAEDGLGSPSSVEEEARSLLAQCSSLDTSAHEIDSILDSHEACSYWDEQCPVCAYLADDNEDMPDELWGGNVFVALSSRNDLSPRQQERIVAAGVTAGQDQALLVHILPLVATNSARISDEVKEVMLSPLEFVGTALGADYGEWARDLLARIHANAAFSDQDKAKFIDFHRNYGVDLDQEEEEEEEEAPSPNSTMECDSCGQSLAVGARFCSDCGGKAIPSVRFCSQCGEKLAPKSRFCPQCGAPTRPPVLSQAEEHDHSNQKDGGRAREDVSELAEWMMRAIFGLPGNKKTKSVGFLAGRKSILVFSVEFIDDVFDLRLNKKVLDLNTLLGEAYTDFTDEDPLEPNLYLHAYWNEEEFYDLGPELAADIALMVGSREWVKTTTRAGLIRDKIEVERWS